MQEPAVDFNDLMIINLMFGCRLVYSTLFLLPVVGAGFHPRPA